MTREEFVLAAWDRGTSDERLTTDTKRDCKIIRQYVGADENSPADFMIMGFVLGVSEGMEIVNDLLGTTEKAPA